MTKLTLSRLTLLLIAMCSIVQVVSGQPPAATLSGEDPFGADTDTTGEPNRQMSGKEFTLDGVLLTASRARSFMVNTTTLQIQPANDHGSMDAGADVGGGMSMLGGAMTSMGGGMGGFGSDMGIPGMGGMSDMPVVVAFIMDDEHIAGRTRIEVLAPQGSRGNYVRLENLPAARSSKTKADKKAAPLWKPAEAKLIKDTISLKIWKEDAIKTLKAEEGRGEQAAASEKFLRAVLSDEYDGQFARQQFELARLQERLKRIQQELTRRQQAKDRVIDVQLGKIILEAQGILGDNQ